MTRIPSSGSMVRSSGPLLGKARRLSGCGVRFGEVALVRHDLAIAAVEGELAPIATLALQVERHARIDGPTVDVKGDSRFLAREDDLVDRLRLVHGVHRAARVALLDVPAVDVE